MNDRLPALGLATTLLAAMIVFSGCKIDSADSVTRNVGINVSGLYVGNSPLVKRNTGNPITQMDVIQNGDRLQAVCNNGLIFRGNIGQVQQNTASFTLKGNTTAGAEGIISGSFRISDNTSTMTGTWAEPSLFSTVKGTASVAPQPDAPPPAGNGNGNGGTNNVSAPIIGISSMAQHACIGHVFVF